MTATMSWELDREHEEFRASVRSFVDRQVRPVVEESEEAGRPPAALLKEMGSAGLLGRAVPEEDGGAAARPLPARGWSPSRASHWTAILSRRRHGTSSPAAPRRAIPAPWRIWPGCRPCSRPSPPKQPPARDGRLRTVVRAARTGPAGRARDDAHRHRDRQRAVHDDDDEPAAAAPGRGVRGRHRIRAAAGQQPVHAGPGRRAGRARADARHYRGQLGLFPGGIPGPGVHR